jgi:SH3 domain-containing YSC84-like protein 1
MRNLIAAGLITLSMTGVAFSQAATDTSKLDGRIDAARAVIHELARTPDKGVPLSVASKATCVIVVPGYKKGAFVFGGQYGQGVASCRTRHSWSAPVFVQITGASFGLQIGAQSTDLVLIGMNHKSVDDMLKQKVKLGGDAAASAGPVGRNAQASTSVLLDSEFLTYSRSKGLFAGIDLTGDVINQNQDDTVAYYGQKTPYQAILSGSVPVPHGARGFVATISAYFARK